MTQLIVTNSFAVWHYFQNLIPCNGNNEDLQSEYAAALQNAIFPPKIHN